MEFAVCCMSFYKTCGRMFNVFHPDDPIAQLSRKMPIALLRSSVNQPPRYRIEPLLNPAYASMNPRSSPASSFTCSLQHFTILYHTFTSLYSKEIPVNYIASLAPCVLPSSQVFFFRRVVPHKGGLRWNHQIKSWFSTSAFGAQIGPWLPMAQPWHSHGTATSR